MKSFLLYTDNLIVLDRMTDSQAGKFIKIIWNFVKNNDENLKNVEFGIEMAVLPIIEKIKINNNLYIAKCMKNKENIEKRWNGKNNTTVYDRIQSNTSVDSLSICKGNNKLSNTLLEIESAERKGKRVEKKENFVKPIIPEIKDYCTERKNEINAETFFDFYEARGWQFKTGQKMKDWKAAIRTWEKNNKNQKSENSVSIPNEKSTLYREL